MLKSSFPRTAKIHISRFMEKASRLFGKLKLSPGVADPETRARAAWAGAAGKKIAEHSRASGLVRGSLVVEVEDVIWQRQLNTLRHFLLRNLRDILGDQTVTDIDFRPMPRRMAPRKAATARPADGIQDPVLGLLYQESKKRELA
jgi:Dna[CI] antecedent DciA-like protein